MKLFIEINDQTIEFIEQNGDDGYTLLKGKANIDYDLIRLGENRYSLIWENRSYLLRFTRRDGQICVNSDGREYVVRIETEQERRIREMTSGREEEQHDVTLKAPIPGLVTKIYTMAGEKINKNDPVLILEAMKMENIIKAPYSCVVSDVLIKTGQSVEQDAALVKLISEN